MSTDTLHLTSDDISAEITPLGAELVRFAARGRELLWHGDPAFWAGRSPLLFPAVGRTKDGVVRVGGTSFPMPQHGVAREKRFSTIAADARSCRLRLGDDAETRRHYPFAFTLEAAYRVEGARLVMEAEVGNPGDVPLPASFGFHPGFAWPLVPGLAKTDHFLAFPADTVLHVARLEDALLGAERTAVPLENGRLALDESLFASGAMVLTQRTSQSVTFAARGAPFALETAFEGLPHLAFWMRPGAPFLCIEPWHGHADPVGFEGELADKPGRFVLAPGASRRFAMTVTVVPAP